ncbi:MAG: SDR family NAD(P)-dependent oxidoreductase [Proteocatella sp.]
MKIDNLFDIRDKYVFITGSTRGIGRSIAEGFIANGANVIIHGRNKLLASRVADEIGAFDFVAGDISKMENIESIVNYIQSRIIKLDVLINNAGFEDHCAIEDMTEEFLDNIYDTNTKSHYFITSKLLQLLKKSSEPSIINITSIHDVVPVRNNSPYCISKAAIAMFTKVSALEFGKYGIRVNNLAPGAIRTEMNETLLKDLEEQSGFDFGNWVPLGRVGEAKEIIGPCIFLASKASSYITGTTFYVDGGYKENLLRY